MGDVRRRWVTQLLALGCLLILFAVLVLGARQLSFTFDEPSHVTSGYAFLARGAIWTIPHRGHPLLVDAWLALPFYLSDPDIPLEDLDGWDRDYIRYVEVFSSFLARTLERSQVLARTPAALLAILLAAVVYRWGRDLWGGWAGVLALGTMVFDPTFLAHGRLATNDVGVTAFGTLGLYLVWRWERALTWRQAGLAGAVLGLTMLAKGSGLLWVVAGMGWVLWIGLRWWKSRPAVGWQVLLMGGLLLAVLWAAYGFEFGTIPGWFPIPVPAPQHWAGILFHADVDYEQSVVILGDVLTTRWLWYFPVAFLLKNPLPFLIAIPLALGALVSRPRGYLQLCVLGLFSVFYTAMAMVLGVNLGYRHMFPVHPFLYLLIAGGIGRLWSGAPKLSRWCMAALGLWYVLGTMRFYPYNLAFFNELAGGPANGWRYLGESNTDWGQGWKALRSFQEARSSTFDYSGPEGYSRITPYDLWERPLPPLRYVAEPLPSPWLFPEPGEYVISANSLSGLYLVDPDNFSWFRYHPPDDLIAHTLFYYRVDAASAPTWLAECTVPRTPLDQEAIAAGFEGIELRVVSFDCRQSWVYPGGGDARGVYGLHGALLEAEAFRERLHLAPSRPQDGFAARHVEGLPLAYRQGEYRALPAFALYEWEGSSSLSLPLASKVGVGPADVPPASLPETAFYGTELPLEGPLTFLGAMAYTGNLRPQSESPAQEEGLEVETWWRVTEEPVRRPLSIMAHLLSEDGVVLGVADGIGVPFPMLASGDLVVQRHSFVKPAEGGAIYLRTGAYWLDTVVSWPVQSVPGNNVLFVPLEWE